MNQFSKNIFNMYAEKGINWISQLPILIKNCETLWGLSNLKPLDNLSYNYVLKGTQNTSPIILKLSLDISGLKKESRALNAFSYFGCVNVLAEIDGALLLECAVPGISLKSYFPSQEILATQIACNLMKTLHQKEVVKDFFPNMNDLLKILDQDWNIAENILQKARRIRAQLLATASEPVLLHGDLHHDNIIQNGSHWVAIDPKGIIGEVACEIPTFIFNPIPELLNSKVQVSIIKNRVKQFSVTLNIDEKRILDWCYIRAVLGWVWSLEDGLDTQYFNTLTKMFDRWV